MAISTSGVSVPQLGQGIDASIYGNKEAPQGMSLRDLVGLSRENIALQKEQALLQPAIEAGKAESATKVTAAKKAQLGLSGDFVDVMRRKQIALINHPTVVRAERDPEFAKAHLSELHDLVDEQKNEAIQSGLDPKLAEQLNAPYHAAIDQSNGIGGRQFFKTRMLSGLDQEAQTRLQPGEYFQAAPVEQGQPTQPAAQQNLPAYSQPEKVYYQPPVAGQPRSQLPSEEADRSFGEKLRLNLKAQQNGYSSQKQNIDNLYDKASSMIGGNIFSDTAIGTGIRKLESMAGSPEYQELEKMLARVQLGQMTQEQQANTDLGRQMTAVANGQSHLDPKIIVNITRQNAANLEKSNAQANAAERAGQKYGDANLTRKFQNEWTKNSDDNRIFEMKYIFNHAASPQEGFKAVSEYIQSQPESKRKELGQKYMNLKKLETEGGL